MKTSVVKEYKKCVSSILMQKYHLNELEAMRAIRSSYFEESLKISRENTLHTDPEEWADDIYEYVYGEPMLIEM